MVRTISRVITNLKLHGGCGAYLPRFRSSPPRSIAALLSLALCLTLFILLNPPTGALKTPAPNVAAASQARQLTLINALKSWVPGQEMPASIPYAAAPCPPEDAANAALSIPPMDNPNIVVDIGANGGHPVTVSALRLNARVVLAVEPDERNIQRLQRLRSRSNPNTTSYVIIHGAAGATSQVMDIRFHKDRDDYGGFTSLDPKKNDVYTQQVQVKPIDEMLDELNAKGPITLLKTDTQGYETQVLTGARKIFSDRRVQALLVEFDPKLLMTRANAVQLLEVIVGYGMKCVHLAFSGRTVKSPQVPRFPHLPIFNSSIPEFYDFVLKNTGWTDLFCLLPP